MMVIPKPMKGFEKSMTASREDVIVNGAIATSASYNRIFCVNIKNLSLIEIWRWFGHVLRKSPDHIIIIILKQILQGRGTS